MAVRQLVAKGANLEAVTSKGWTPLHVAAFHGSLQAAEALLEGREDPAADVGRQGHTLPKATRLACLCAQKQREREREREKREPVGCIEEEEVVGKERERERERGGEVSDGATE
jgi:ankyrin repeat protein